MILSGLEIKKQIERGSIVISPFEEKQLNPNSYNLRLADKLLVYENADYALNMCLNNPVREIQLSEYGFILKPDTLYLGSTVEYTETHELVPMLEGRSSVGRLGISVHVTAGFGDIGFQGHWTLEITCIHPVIIFPNVEICQVCYHQIVGDYIPYASKYQYQCGAVPSKMFADFKR